MLLPLAAVLVLPARAAGPPPAFTTSTESTTSTAKPDSARASAIQQNRKDLAARIAEADGQATPELAQQLGLTVDDLKTKAARLRTLDDLYERQIAALNQTAAVEKGVADLKAGRAPVSVPEDKPSYTLSELDQFRETIESLRLGHGADASLLANARSAIEPARQQVDTARKALADSQRILDANRDPAAAPRLQLNRDLAELSVPVAEATAGLREIEVELAEKEAARSDTRLRFGENVLAKMEANTFFVKRELNAKLADIEKKRSEIKAQLQEEQKNLALNKARAADARNEMNKGTEGGDEAMMKKMAVLSLRNASEETSQLTVRLLQEFLGDPDSPGHLDIETDLWNLRYDVLSGPADARLDTNAAEVAKRTDMVGQRGGALETRLQVLRKQINDQRRKLDEWQESGGDRAPAEQELDALVARENVYARSISYLDELDHLAQRISDEITEQRARRTLGERVRGVADKVRTVWNLGYHSETTKTTLTVGQVVTALLLLLFGVALSRRATRALRRALIARSRLDLSAAASVEKLLYYVLIVLVALAAMHIVNIPLTVFTLFGGALAIGVGFGAQNIINNFISGLILMIDRPIRIGDIIEVDRERGRIVNIGARCSQLHLFSGVDVLVPNSAFLEKNVINWTLTDSRIQFSVRVGVAHGSSPRDVERLLRQAVEEHARIVKDPPPVVLFSEFGPNALILEVFFWLDVTTLMEAQMVCSGVRFEIDRLFGEAGIKLA